ncbi:MAG: biopolymer transporter ExbD [Phycisphaeraceae bacterium]|nr:biopolymer transporter ExbD [Phycisphaeraceae bacterium]MCW5761709.1 biopolymer transporter ExbD [Phycisphaeraceae bacterium]
MIRFRRTSPDVRLEMTPLIDVIFLLLTFFIFSLVLLVRADVLDIKLPSINTGDKPSGTNITIVLDNQGSLFFEGEPIELEALAEAIRARREVAVDAALLIAADREGASGRLIELVAYLSREGLGDFSLIGVQPPPAPAE